MSYLSDDDLTPENVVFQLFGDAEKAHRSGNLQGRLDAMRQVLSIAQQEGRVPLEISSLRDLANVYQDWNKLDYAHTYRMAASKLANRYADQLPPELVARVENDISRSFIEAQDWQKAEFYILNALSITETIKDVDVRQTSKVAFLNNLSLIDLGLGRSAKAIQQLQEALVIAERYNDAYLLSLTHLNMAVYYNREIQLVTGHKHAQEAYRYAEISRDPSQRTYAQLLLSTIITRSRGIRGTLNDSPELIEQLENTIRMAQNLRNPSLISEAEISLGTVYEQTGRHSEAGAHFDNALTALEKVRLNLGFEQFQLSFFASQQRLYEQVIFFQLRNGQVEQSFQTIEQLHSRLLLTLLGPSRWDLSDWEEEQLARLREVLGRYGIEALHQISAQSEAEGDANFTTGTGTFKPMSSENDALALQKARRSFMDLYQEQRTHRLDWLGRQSPPLINLQDVQKKLLGPQDALLTYMAASDGLAIISLTRDSCHFQHLNLPQAELEKAVTRLCQTMSTLQDEVLDPLTAEQWFNRQVGAPVPRRLQHHISALEKELDELFALLIAPILPAICAQTHWIIVPSGPLHRVPWAALHSQEGYLVETHTLSLLPSASVGVNLLQSVSNHSGEIVLFGDPDPDDLLLGLPASRHEVNTVYQAFPKAQAPFLGDQASKEHFLKWSPRAQLLHLACHHCFDGSAPLLSFIKLSGDLGDQFLYTFEVADLELQAALVTLSACESGRSQIATGDEQFGIVRSFLAAGVQSVISTLWHIQDQSASFFFNTFYQRAQNGPLDQALADTQRAMLLSPVFHLPCFWAPYMLTGHWRDPLRV